MGKNPNRGWEIAQNISRSRAHYLEHVTSCKLCPQEKGGCPLAQDFKKVWDLRKQSAIELMTAPE
jgi:hypothetical protein